MKALIILTGLTGLYVILRTVIASYRKIRLVSNLLLQELYLNYQIKGSKL